MDKEASERAAPAASPTMDAKSSETGSRQEESSSKESVSENRLAPFNPTCDQAQQTALDLLRLDENDVLFDLGCGDGRLLVTAVENLKGLRCVGIEMDPVFTSRAVKTIGELPDEMQTRIEIREGDVLELGYKDKDAPPVAQQKSSTATEKSKGETTGELCQNLTLLNDATAVYLFLVPNGLKKVKPLLDRVVEIRKKQGREFSVVAYMFQVRGWEPTLVNSTTKGNVPLYLYRFEASS
jgi:hypothetical protein